MALFRSLSWKLAVLLVSATLLPLSVFGIVAVWQARSAARQAVTAGHQRVAARAAGQIQQYLDNALAILRSTAENVSRADLDPRQRERVIRNMAIAFEEFDEIALANEKGELELFSGVGSSRIMETPYGEEAIAAALHGRDYRSPVYITDELVPAMIVALPTEGLGSIDGAALAEIDLLHLWRLAGDIRIGEHGSLSVIDPEGRLIASGDGEMKRRVFQGLDHPDAEHVIALGRDGGVAERAGEGGASIVAAAAALPAPTGWTVVMEQPAAEAFALADRLTTQLVLLVLLFAASALLVGYFGGRWQVVRPIAALIGGTKRIAAGDLDHPVELRSADEFGNLARSFNTMAGDLAEMQDRIRRQERHAVFGRIASGLVHDLKHPVRSIKNASQLMERMHDDPEYRETFRRVVDREFAKIDTFLENLHTLTHDIPYHPIRLELGGLLDEIVETFAAEVERGGVAIVREGDASGAAFLADRFSITRALSNLVGNALQAMPDGGRLTIAVREEEGATVLAIGDTGCGIEPERLETIFADFVTTKRKGLGLGLALAKRILDQHDIAVAVESAVGEGTTFTLRIPAYRSNE